MKIFSQIILNLNTFHNKVLKKLKMPLNEDFQSYGSIIQIILISYNLVNDSVIKKTNTSL